MARRTRAVRGQQMSLFRSSERVVLSLVIVCLVIVTLLQLLFPTAATTTTTTTTTTAANSRQQQSTRATGPVGQLESSQTTTTTTTSKRPQVKPPPDKPAPASSSAPRKQEQPIEEPKKNSENRPQQKQQVAVAGGKIKRGQPTQPNSEANNDNDKSQTSSSDQASQQQPSSKQEASSRLGTLSTTTTTTTTTTRPTAGTVGRDQGELLVEQPSGAGHNNETTPTTSTSKLPTASKLTGHLRFEFQRYDGWYNNLANSDWGTSNSRLRRKVAPAYSDGVYQMNDDGRPSARLLSQKMMRGEDGLASRRNLTTIFAFFGQIISSEILMASESGCPIEMHRIKIDKCDPMYDPHCRGGRTMPFYRAAYDPTTGQSPNLPREQLNRVTSWIDGSFIYSTSETWLNTMRSFDGRGTLKMVPSALLDQPAASGKPIKESNYYAGGALGDAHLHETVGALLADANKQLLSSAAAPGLATADSNSNNNKLASQLKNVPMSLFGYPMRNKMRAPLVNQMPAHHLQMKTAERMFLLGDPRTNQNPIILTFGILFYRWHNVLAERIHAQHPDWSDEEIFQRARRLVIASLQNIFLYEYLPTLLDTPSPNSPAFQKAPPGTTTDVGSGNSSAGHDLLANPFEQLSELQLDNNDLIRPYSGYKPDLHPGISHVFQSAAFRFGHTMIPPGLYLRDERCHFLKTKSGYKGVRLCSTWWNAEEVVSKVGVETLLMGAASQIAEREDYVLCNDVRDKLFGPLDFSRRDLAALNIMRGRDNGIADYNTVRVAFKLPKIESWQEINPKLYAKQPELFEELARLYNYRLDNIDLYIGGMLESDLERGRPGPLFRRIIKEQFERLRDADRFWFENLESGIFSQSEIDEIRQIRLYDIIVNATLIPEQAIQPNVFQFVHQQDPCPQPGQLSSSELQPCYIVRGHSYFKGNEVTYSLVCLTLILIPILCACAAHLVVTYQDRKRRQFKAKQEYQRNIAASRGSRNGHSGKASPTSSSSISSSSSINANEQKPSEKIYSKEWLHSNLKRKIKLKFGSPPDETIYVLDRQGQVQRKLALAQAGPSIVVELSVDNEQQQRGANYLGGVGHLLPQPPHPLQATGGSSVSLSASSYLDGGGGKSSLANSSSSLVGSGHSPSPTNEQRQSLNELTAADLDEPVDHKPMALIRVARNHDLVLQFSSVQHRRKFVFKLQAYLQSINRNICLFKLPRDIMLANAETKERRQQRLEQFFREAYALTFGLGTAAASSSGANQSASDAAQPISKVSPDISLVMRTSLSRGEFAEALGMRADSLFVRQMFNCIDKDGNGVISFQEFLDTVVKFSRGKPDDKLRIVFDMCDHQQRGVIEKKDLVEMLRSLVDIAKTKYLSEEELLQTIHEMFRVAGLDQKPLLDYEDFKLIISTSSAQAGQEGAQQQHQQHKPTIIDYSMMPIGLDMKGAKRNFLVDTSSAPYTTPSSASIFQAAPAAGDRQRKLTVLESSGSPGPMRAEKPSQRATSNKHKAKSTLKKLNDNWKAFVTELEEHRQDIVYLLMFYVIVAVLFFERFINYSYLSEHMDLRHVMGVGIAITRGSAAALSFCYAMLLLSMCRNLMTWIRTMAVREYIPLDSHVKFHKIVAMTALLMTVLHSVGHCVNFFHVTQQPVEHLRCLTKEMQFSGESRPTFFYWIFQTVTGVTGLLLWCLCSIVYVFAQQRVRLRAYSFFWSTHQLYYLIYALTLLHGSSKLTGSPRSWIFFIIPAILFTIDKIMSLQAKLWQLEIFETECLPSDVIAVKFARPPSFQFLSGQWVRVACTAFRPHEFHAFTLTSAPQDDYLSVHVRAQGPWTWKLRSLFDPANLQYNKLLHQQLPPRIRIEGPFGGGNQDWYKYEVAVMIGGGIGVTPYASILNDLVFGTSTNRHSSVNYKKVYFIWICPSHRNFEWFIDVLREVEQRDVTNILEMHIFITQFFHKFDLRTTMLYICENHFQRISNRSLFTGLKAINHFGRPDIASLLQYVQNKHSCVSKVGVFSCGPKAMTKSVTEACEKVNKRRKLPFFLHQYENFS